ncbi:pyridoxamine 5-phosphate oxidase [Methanoculleus taiwanensis]|uniref:Pyridoxamine 5-phosphate oxidase n=1 Tax=Methanoculleus taiwanensis TaxID=1550565 RepID=A0A498H0B5_9EURY|nr:pyridoxamine 5'-phosphate oxidase family protein [Methanoculleus taiwanensis]RXE56058.1 pyridoxamine 5-phosphate oxidase [Methanoculleus taiwanensis]
MAQRLMDYFNKQPRIGTLSTASRDGKVDAAVFGSPHMVDEKTIMMGFGDNRSLANLQENPNAVYLIMEPGESIMDWKGVRVYLKMTASDTSGAMLQNLKQQIAEVAGEQAAEMIHAAASFEITEVRPLIDIGQGWEASI